ncbi:MAG: WXG100 family type VII secretion target [Mycobacteriaceae bacterium]
MSSEFVVDLDHLLVIIDQMDAFNRKAEHWCADVDTRVAQMHVNWSGQSAQAQKAAHDQWVAGVTHMREALQGLRSVGMGAHENYSQAVISNEQMWQ